MYSKNISLEATNQSFSGYSGLFLLEQLWKTLKLEKRIKKLIPKKKRNRGPSQIKKVKLLLFSFAVGNDCLDDLNDLRDDPFYQKLTDSGVAARTMGDFLRNFGNRHVEKMQVFLVEIALQLRSLLFKHDKDFILTMDSTPHEHYAKKMEGLAYNYKNLWCLDSQNAYDQYGISYLFDLRAGNTHSGKESEFFIHKIFSQIPVSLSRYFRADSAYGKRSVYEALMSKSVKFAIVLKSSIGKYVRDKTSLSWKKTKLSFFDSNKCELSMGVYPLKTLGNLRVVFIRAPKKEVQLELLDDNDPYDYYSIITDHYCPVRCLA